MSRDPDTIECRIADLFAATRGRALSINEITTAAFALRHDQVATHAQRLAAAQAAERMLQRMQAALDRSRVLHAQAVARTMAAFEREQQDAVNLVDPIREYLNRLKADPAWIEADRLYQHTKRLDGVTGITGTVDGNV